MHKVNTLSAYFNSHAHVERDVVTISSALKNGNFNSHAHVERDAPVAEFFKATLNFNSHAHVERDRNTLLL